MIYDKVIIPKQINKYISIRKKRYMYIFFTYLIYNI